MNKIFLENISKNIILIVTLVLVYSPVKNSLLNSPVVEDKAVLGSLLVAISILAVIACFGCYAFTYEKVNHESAYWRFFAHLTTGVLMLLIGLSLEMTSVLTGLLLPNFFIFDLSLLLLYISIIFYDFWDLRRAKV